MSYSGDGLWTPDNPDGSTTGSGPAGGGLLNPNGSTSSPSSATASGGAGSGNTSSVIDNVNADLDGNSSYIQQAKSAGADYANSRGVLNSSIGAGASQASAYQAVTPIATADASNITSKDLSAQGFAQNTALNTQQNTAASNLSSQNYGQSADLQAQGYQQSSALSTQGYNQNTALQAQSEGSQAALQASQNTENTNLAQIQQATQLQVANMNVASDQQDKAQAAATTYASIYSNMVDSINSNTQIPADARQAYLQNAQTLYNNGMSLIEQTYNVSLDWGQQSTASGASGGYAAPQAAPTSAAQLNTQNAATAANYNQPATTSPTSATPDNTVAYTDPGGNQYNAEGQYLGTV